MTILSQLLLNPEIPVVTEPFEKILIDCMDPLPKTKKGNQYLLTIMDTTTRYPKAVVPNWIRLVDP